MEKEKVLELQEEYTVVAQRRIGMYIGRQATLNTHPNFQPLQFLPRNVGSTIVAS